MFTVWPFAEKKGSCDTLFIIPFCIGTGSGNSSGSTLCCVFDAFTLSDPFPNSLFALGGWSVWTARCLWFPAGRADKQFEGRRKVKLGCPFTPSSRALSQAGTSFNQRAQLLSRLLPCTVLSSRVRDLLPLLPLGLGCQHPNIHGDFLHSAHTSVSVFSLHALHLTHLECGP